MLCAIQKRIAQKSYCFVRSFILKTFSCQENHFDEHLLKFEDNYTSVRKEDGKFLKIAIVGLPNAGKSTLINQLVNRSICPTSSKVHTTRAKCNAIYTSDNVQLVFTDTPGLVTPKEQTKYRLSNSFMEDQKISSKSADIVGVVHDAGNRWTRSALDHKSLDLLHSLSSHVSTILILNKIDQVKDKTMLLELIRVLTNKNNWPNFDDVFLVSAIDSNGVDTLREYLLYTAKSKDWQYNENAYTDQSPEVIVKDTVRAKLLDSLPKEIPYLLHIKLEYFEIEPDGRLNISVIIECPNKKRSSSVIGVKAQRIKHVAEQCEHELRHAFRTPVKLKLNVQLKT